MCLTDRTFLQTHIIFSEYLLFQVFSRDLYITLGKCLGQEGIAGLIFSSPFYTASSSIKAVSSEKGNRLFYDISEKTHSGFQCPSENGTAGTVPHVVSAARQQLAVLRQLRTTSVRAVATTRTVRVFLKTDCYCCHTTKK